MLVILTFEQSGLGRDRLTNLADELHRAFIEVHRRPPGIGCQVEYVLDASDIFAVDLQNAPPVPAPGLEAIFGQAPLNSSRETGPCVR